jgi:hypothetical protein
MSTSITNSYATGNVTSTEVYGGLAVGGLVGSMSGAVTNSYYLASASQAAATASSLAFSRVTKTYNGTITITNDGSTAMSGPILVLLSGLPFGVT